MKSMSRLALPFLALPVLLGRPASRHHLHDDARPRAGRSGGGDGRGQGRRGGIRRRSTVRRRPTTWSRSSGCSRGTSPAAPSSCGCRAASDPSTASASRSGALPGSPRGRGPSSSSTRPQDGTYRILHLMLGAFHKRLVGGPRPWRRATSPRRTRSARRTARGRRWTPCATSTASPTGWTTAPPASRTRAVRARERQGHALDRRPRSSHPDDRQRQHPDPLVPLRRRPERGLEGRRRRPARPRRWTPPSRPSGRRSTPGTTIPGANIQLRLRGHDHAPPAASTRSDNINAIVFDDPYRNDPNDAVEGTFDCGSRRRHRHGRPVLLPARRGPTRASATTRRSEGTSSPTTAPSASSGTTPRPPRRSSPTSSATPWASATPRTPTR